MWVHTHVRKIQIEGALNISKNLNTKISKVI